MNGDIPIPRITEDTIANGTLVSLNKNITCPTIPRIHPDTIRFLLPYFGINLGVTR